MTVAVTRVREDDILYLLYEGDQMVTALQNKWTTFLDQQHRYPTGLVGQLIGERMVRQHTPETVWTLNQLQIKPRDRVLELGAGAGRGLALAARQAPHGYVTGIDLSPTMIDAARRRNAAALHAGRLTLLRANISAVPVGDQQFDKIFSIHTFYFWPHPRNVIADLVRMLKRGGTLVVTLATGRKSRNGDWVYWPIHQQVEALVQELQRGSVTTATLRFGPNSRQYNNLAMVIHK